MRVKRVICTKSKFPVKKLQRVERSFCTIILDYNSV